MALCLAIVFICERGGGGTVVHVIIALVDSEDRSGLDWLLDVTFNDISVIHVTAHRCAGGLDLMKKLNLRSGCHAIDIS